MNATSLKFHNTLRIESICPRVLAPLDVDEFISCISDAGNYVILGNGSNVLLPPEIKNSVILTGGLDGLLFSGSTINVQCGVKTMRLSQAALDASLSGFEFLIGIPGSLGGAIFMNASAHGQCISDNLLYCDVFDSSTSEFLKIEKKDAEFAYRNSIFKKNPNYIILGASFELAHTDYETIKAKMDENTFFRRDKQPGLNLPNAGSVFKNPPGMSAGKLLDECGVKGERVGGAQVWEKHANFIVNLGNATSRDVTVLMFNMYNKVKDKFNIELEPEIVFLDNNEYASDLEREIWNTMLKQK